MIHIQGLVLQVWCSSPRDHYSVLGVPADAEAATVRRAYRQLAAKWHPDKWAAADAAAQEQAKVRFSLVLDAYEVLFDDMRRAKYDARTCYAARGAQS